MLDQIDSGAMAADEETRLRIEGGVVALDAVVGMLEGLQSDVQEPAAEDYFSETETEGEGEDVPDGAA
ncbi:hypothetical protein [Actinomycetospora atypica]|uniref:Uncharacterized protein n=1 Tax=Actinomycetospora atypica TaxID=1290095 RepID=A0ABV9YHM9_9PSEU